MCLNIGYKTIIFQGELSADLELFQAPGQPGGE